ncbi:MAG TPA: hypothetical protein VE961_22300 [Pyrinomonadaceae bacterium]|nr:hypothetical protein [Pyrinomonadaceae bacterium]
MANPQEIGPRHEGIALAMHLRMKHFLNTYRTPVLLMVAVLCFAAGARAQTAEMATRGRTVTVNEDRPAAPAVRRVLVRSTALLVGSATVEDKLLKNSEFKRLGLVITRDLTEADLVLELRHDVLTMYVFTVVDAKTLTVIAGGKLSSLGGTVAGKVASRFVKEMNGLKQP